jgi:hypothetical protein
MLLIFHTRHHIKKEYRQSLFFYYFLFNGHGEELGHDEMIVIVSDDGGIVDFFEEASFEVDKVLAVDLHDAGEAVDEPLNLLIVVELVSDDCGHA